MHHHADNPTRSHYDYVRHSNHQCPLCNTFLVRTPRRAVDRLWSVFKPVLRYRCERFSCQWHGNLPRSAGGDNLPGGDSHTAARQSVPVAFIVHMALAAVGVILVFVISNSDPMLLREAFLMDAPGSEATATSVAQNTPTASPVMRAGTDPGTARASIRQFMKD